MAHFNISHSNIDNATQMDFYNITVRKIIITQLTKMDRSNITKRTKMDHSNIAKRI